MSSRIFLAALPALLLSFGMAAAVSCGSTSTTHPLLDGGLGGSTTTTTTTSHSSTSGGTGGHPTCSAIEKCATVTDCPVLSTLCIVNACTSACCVQTNASKGTMCGDSGGKVCDGSGKCVGCVKASDCATGMSCSTTNVCLTTHCTNGVKDADETDIDCGGKDCLPCGDGKTCLKGTDCTDKVCTGGTCAAATCSDGVKNGMETDIDCGGPVCSACVDGEGCVTGTDCKSFSCQAMKCAAATCMDGIKNQDETDVDCGGTHCAPCADTKACKQATDCVDKVCSGTPLTCQLPTCTDGVQNGMETDIDCGGPVCSHCNIGQKCTASTDCVGGQCQGTCQCPMGMLDMPIQGGGVYCIDANEVSYASYNTFYSANPSTSNQPASCSWNLNWTPSGDWPYVPTQVNDPVRFVNWCQAAAYCKYQGRRLCGKIGGGPAPQSSFADFHQDQWFNACSSQGQNCTGAGCYPYGTTYSTTLCNGADANAMPPGPHPYTDFMNCLGGPPGLLEMSGNVAEWEDSCSASAGASDQCAVRGGSYQDSQSGLRCDSGQTTGPVTRARNYTGRDVGIRCCL